MTRQFEMNAVPEETGLQIMHPLEYFTREFNQGLRRREGNKLFVRIFSRTRVMPELEVEVVTQDNREMVDLHAVMLKASEIRWLPESPVAAEFRHLMYKNLW